MNEKFFYYNNLYKTRAQEYSPILNELQSIHESFKLDELIEKIGIEKSKKLMEVPTLLYHGSPNSYDVLMAQASTQPGKFVYATDNPMSAVFFAIFRNSSEIRGHIREYIDEEGKYKVRYEIDERVEGALEKTISDRNVTIHVCDGNEFEKGTGKTFIQKEWISKDGRDVKPIDKYDVNVQQLFQQLENEGLVSYNKWSSKKDKYTILDVFSKNYLFQISKGEEAERQVDEYADNFTNEHWQNHKEFVNYLRNDVKKIMKTEKKEDELSLTDNDFISKRISDTQIFIKNTFMSKNDNNKDVYDSSKIHMYLSNKINENISKIEQQKQQLLEEKRKVTVNEEKTLDMEKQKVFVKTNPNVKYNGYIDSLILATITGFASGIILMIVYSIIK